MKSTLDLRRLPLFAAIPGLLAVAFFSLAAQEKAPFTPTPALLPEPPRSAARIAWIENHKKIAPQLAAQFEAYTHTTSFGEVMPYRLFKPKRLEPGRKYPLVVFLHGAAGSGADNQAQLQGANMFGGLVWTLPENQQRHPAFVLAPQSNVNWPCVVIEPGQRPKLCPGLGAGVRQAFDIIDKLMAELPIDPARIYVTGHSMGGAGTWHMIAQRPGFFAAAVPVSGLPDPATAATVKGIPIWNFHGDADEVEPVATSRRMIEAILKAGGHPLYTEYPGVGHNAFMWAYTEPAVVEWVFAQRRPAAPRLAR